MLEITQNAERIHARLNGEITIFQADELFSLLKPLVVNNKDLTLDAGDANEMDSSAVQILLVVRDALKANGKELTLVNHSDAVLDIMAVMGMSGCFNDPVLESAERARGESGS